MVCKTQNIAIKSQFGKNQLKIKKRNDKNSKNIK